MGTMLRQIKIIMNSLLQTLQVPITIILPMGHPRELPIQEEQLVLVQPKIEVEISLQLKQHNLLLRTPILMQIVLLDII
jgi:hypothetical protein